jgi:CSLREA domain-containing protein
MPDALFFQNREEIKMSQRFIRLMTSLILALTLGLTGISTAYAASFTVNSIADQIDANPGDGVCDTGNGECTLRAAIQEANALPGDDTILLPEGTFTLSIAGAEEDAAATGDLDITGNLTINGTDAANTIIDGNALDRVIHISGSSSTVTITNLTIQNGAAPGSGGGIFNSGTLTLSDSILRNNFANCTASALYNDGSFISNHTVISQNVGGGIYCLGMAVLNISSGIMTLNSTSVTNNKPDGGIYNYATLTLNNSTVSGNTGGGVNDTPGGIYNWSGTTVLNNSTVSGNTTNSGGGIFTGGGGTLRLNNSTVIHNSASTGGGIYNHPSAPADVILRNTIVADNIASENSPDCSGSIGSEDYNLIGDTSSCDFAASTGDLTNIDAKLGSLIGSPAYHPLLSTSPAIEAGNPAGCTDQDGNPLATDQRGAARVGVCDIGSYEYTIPGPATSLSIFSGNNQSGVTTLPFSDLLQVLVMDDQGSPVEGALVDFSAPGSGASGTFADTGTNTTSVNANASGIATTSIFTANTEAGAYSVSASTAGAGSVTFSLQQILLPPNDPPNDYFVGRVAFTALPFSATVDITESGIEPNEPQQCVTMEKTVWYAFTPTENMVIQLDTQGSAISSNLNLYRSSGPGLANLVTTNICTYYNNGSTTFLAEANQTYYLQVGGVNGQAGSLQINVTQVPVPVNDKFADAQVIPSLPFSATEDVTGAVTESGEPQYCVEMQKTIWYSFTPTESMHIRVDMQGSSGGNVNIYHATGPGLSDLSFLGCADLSQFLRTFTFLAEANETYYVQVGAFQTMQVNLQQVFPPPNDNFANPAAISSIPFSATVDVTDVSIEPDEPQNCFGMNKTVWYAFTPLETMTILADTQGSSIGANLNVYQPNGPGIADQNFLGCTLNTGSTIFTAEAGQLYYIQAGNLVEPEGTIQINLQQLLPQENDNFAAATSIPSLSSPIDFDSRGATFEGDEPAPSCAYPAPPYKTIWFAFAASQDGSLSASVSTSTFYPFLAAYSGTALNNLTELGCVESSNRLTFQTVAGQTYYVQVGGFNGEGGTGTFLLEPPPPPVTGFYYYPGNPSRFDTVQFYDNSFDPENIGIQTWNWDFGDGTPLSSDQYPTHAYLADGDYNVTLTVTTFDGRSASMTQTVQVRTQFIFTIDIKPGSQTNPINPRSSGKIPVAILSTPDFNAPLEVDRASLTFGSTGNEHSLVSCNKKGTDVNGDGLKDLMCHFKTKLTGFKFGDTEGILKGQTLSGLAIEARDLVRVLHASYP